MPTTRRTFLRGTGVAVALPWLESLPVWGADPAAPAPKRFAALFMGNGINGNHWWAKGSGADLEFGKSLLPLAPVKTKVNLFSGLFNKSATGVGIHPGQTGNVLSGAALQKGAELRGGVSIDQVLAAHVGPDTPQPSLVLGCEQPTTGYHETNFSLAYSSHISWQNATSPVPMEVYPSLAFDTLFGGRGDRRTRSVLDAVRDDAASLTNRVSGSDRVRLDEYLSSVREVEKRVAPARAARDATAGRDPAAVATMPRPANGLPEDLRDHLRLMCDVIALGFQTDRTRVATLLMARDLSGLTYPFLGVRSAHHPASHSDLSDEYEKITTFYVGQLAYLATKLDAMREGERSVLDNSFLMFVSNMWAGSRHDSNKLPVVTVGGLGGTLATGRVLDYSTRGDANRKLCGLYHGVATRMGVPTTRFGDAEAPLAGL